MSEISALGPRLRPLRCYADTPADACYNCTEAFEQLFGRGLRCGSACTTWLHP